MTKLERLQSIGIRRLGSPKRGFRYESQNGRLPTADLERIEKIKVPPAWKFGGGCISNMLIFIIVFWLLGYVNC